MTAIWSASDLVARWAIERGDAPAMLDGLEVVSWAELDRRCEAVATRMRATPHPRGGIVLVDGEASIDGVVRILGITRAGGVAAVVPPGLTVIEREAAKDALDPSPEPGGDGFPGGGRALGGAGVAVLTSGTTSRPKGVVLPIAALAASADAWLAFLPPATGWLLALSLGHVAGLGVVWRAIAAGLPMRIVPGSEPAAILAALRTEPVVSHVSLVPAQLVRLLDAAGDGAPPATLRAVLLGGGTIPPALVTRALDAGWPVVPTYGLSEAGSGVTALATADARQVPSSAGRPLPGVTVEIDAPDADGIGEIVVTTPARFIGYSGAAGRHRRHPYGRSRAPGRGRAAPCRRPPDRQDRPRRRERLAGRGRGGAHGPSGDHRGRRGCATGRPARPGPGRRDRPPPRDDRPGRRGDRRRLPRSASPGSRSRSRSSASTRCPGRPAASSVARPSARLVDGATSGILARPGGDEIGWRVTGSGRRPIVLLPGTLSNAAQLDRLAGELAGPGDLVVHAIDRRGMRHGPAAEPGATRCLGPRRRPARVPRRPRDRPGDRRRGQLRRRGGARARGAAPGPRPRARRL